jgi:uncharacterized OsmC-like protein
MSTLNDFLKQKRVAVLARDEKFAKGELEPMSLDATARAAGRSGIRHIQIRQHQILNDSPADFAGYDLGPSTPETMMGVLGACGVHICQMQAAARQVPLDSIEVIVNGTYDPRAGRDGFENVPYHPTDINYTVNVESSASTQSINDLFEAVEETCPVLSLVKNPQTIRTVINHIKTTARNS